MGHNNDPGVPPVSLGPFNTKEVEKYIRDWRQFLSNRCYKELEEIQASARANPRFYDYIEWLYQDICGDNILRYNQLAFPMAVFPAPKTQRDDLESILVKPLQTDPGNDEIDKIFEDTGQYYDKKVSEGWQDWKKKLKELVSGESPEISLEKIKNHLKVSPARSWDGYTYRMIKFEHQEQLKLTCGIGKYSNSIKSCDTIETELLVHFGEKNPQSSDFSKFTEKISLVRYICDKGNPLEESLGRSAAIAISTLVIFIEDGKYKCLVKPRSEEVAVHQNLLHVIPSFMFQPVVQEFDNEYSIRHNIYREYLEEIFGRKDLDNPRKEWNYDFFYDDPNLMYILDLEKKKKARFYFTGVAINLLNLRPEICTLLLIKDPNWIKNHGRAKRVNSYQLTKLNFNWEYKSGDKSTNISEGKGRIDLTADLVMPDNFKPEKFVPPAVAALKLGVDVAREELGFH